MEIIPILHNIRSTYNVGAILRTAEGLGIKSVILSGYTPRVDDPDLLPHLREKLNHEIAKTALGAEKMLEIYSSGDIFSTLRDLRAKNYKIAGLENNVTGVPLFLLTDPEVKAKIGFLGPEKKLALILGEEVHGIDRKIYDSIDFFLEIPMKGRKESFNVSVAAGIALYELTKS